MRTVKSGLDTRHPPWGILGALASLVLTLGAIVISLSLLPALLVALAIDGWVGASVDEPEFLVRFVIFGLLVGVAAFLIGRHKGFLVAPAIFVVCMLALPFIDVSAVKPAVRAVNEIQPGMTESDVRAVLDRHFPEQGRFPRPHIGKLYHDRLSFALDPTDGDLNSAVVYVDFSDGRCVRAGFSPD